MVKISLIRESNRQVDGSSAPRVAVFVGGTAGIGKITLAEIVALGTDFRAYVVGRKESEQAFGRFREELRQVNGRADVVWVEGQVSLLSEVKRVCDHIKTLEDSVDLLFMTTGYAPWEGRKNTAEGLDVSQALSFYSRICFAENLLPLLRASQRARVITVGAGGFETERALDVDDLNVEKPRVLWSFQSHMHMYIMVTLFLERLAEAKDNRSIVFIHSHPFIVRTGNLYRGWGNSWWGPWFAAVFMDPVLMLVAYSLKESAERHLYQVTSAAFGGKGPLLPGVVAGQTTRGEKAGGLFLVTHKCDTVLNAGEMAKLRVKAQDAVWEKAYQIIGPHV